MPIGFGLIPEIDDNDTQHEQDVYQDILDRDVSEKTIAEACSDAIVHFHTFWSKGSKDVQEDTNNNTQSIFSNLTLFVDQYPTAIHGHHPDARHP